MSDEAFERALAALARREHTTGELRDWLTERGFEAAAIESAVGSLIESGAVDDERFAVEFAADKRELRGWGPERIREALSARGVDGHLIDAALAADGHDEQLERAVALLQRRGEALEDERSRSRAVAYLARRGYESEVAYDAVRGLERRSA